MISSPLTSQFFIFYSFKILRNNLGYIQRYKNTEVGKRSTSKTQAHTNTNEWTHHDMPTKQHVYFPSCSHMNYPIVNKWFFCKIFHNPDNQRMRWSLVIYKASLMYLHVKAHYIVHKMLSQNNFCNIVIVKFVIGHVIKYKWLS
jgi:hypothetical protein